MMYLSVFVESVAFNIERKQEVIDMTMYNL